MSQDPIPDEVRRFMQTTIVSVPFAEALLLFLASEGGELETRAVARRLYIAEAAATVLVDELRAAGIVEPGSTPDRHRFKPRDAEHERRLRLAARYYTTHLIEATDLIHSSTTRNALRFADAFKFRKEP